MAKFAFLLPLCRCCCLFLLFSPTSSEESVNFFNGQVNTWCVAKPSASDEELAANINFACDQVNCKLIQEGGDCYYPNTTINHASVAMNLYYKAMGRNSWNCDFRNSGVIAVTDPSYGCCNFA